MQLLCSLLMMSFIFSGFAELLNGLTVNSLNLWMQEKDGDNGSVRSRNRKRKRSRGNKKDSEAQ